MYKRKGRRIVLSAASIAAACDTLNRFAIALAFRHSANACCVEVVILCLHTLNAAEVFKTGLLPLGYQCRVSNFFLQAVVVQFSTDGLLFHKQIVNVSANLMVDSENGPKRLRFSLAFVRLGLSWMETNIPALNTCKIHQMCRRAT
jgi:hypothetical protein